MVTCKVCGNKVDRDEADRKMGGGYTCRACLIGPEEPIYISVVRSSWCAFEEATGSINYGETLSKELHG